jgi:hypothetical protein
MPVSSCLVAPPHPVLRATFSPLGRRGSAPRLLRNQCFIETRGVCFSVGLPQAPSSPQRGEGGPEGRMRGTLGLGSEFNA